MVLILDGNTEHGANARRKTNISKEKKIIFVTALDLSKCRKHFNISNYRNCALDSIIISQQQQGVHMNILFACRRRSSYRYIYKSIGRADFISNISCEPLGYPISKTILGSNYFISKDKFSSNIVSEIVCNQEKIISHIFI